MFSVTLVPIYKYILCPMHNPQDQNLNIAYFDCLAAFTVSKGSKTWSIGHVVSGYITWFYV